MRIDILTTFTEMFPPVLGASILGRAAQKGILEFNLCDIRQYSENKHHNTDDYPFGGGAGMVMLAQPIYSCLDAVDTEHKARRILLSPRGRTLSPEVARELAKEEHLLFLCGHYEGIDERVNHAMDEDLSIGDYVLTGGELAAMVAIDCIARFIPGVLGSSESAETESFSDGLVEMIVKAFVPALYASLGMFIPLIVVNCIILARAEAFASKNGVLLSAADGLGMGAGFTLAITVIGIIRELLGNGSVFGLSLFGEGFEPMLLSIMAPGGFLVFGLVLGVANYFMNKAEKKKTEEKGVIRA